MEKYRELIYEILTVEEIAMLHDEDIARVYLPIQLGELYISYKGSNNKHDILMKGLCPVSMAIIYEYCEYHNIPITI